MHTSKSYALVERERDADEVPRVEHGDAGRAVAPALLSEIRPHDDDGSRVVRGQRHGLDETGIALAAAHGVVAFAAGRLRIRVLDLEDDAVEHRGLDDEADATVHADIDRLRLAHDGSGRVGAP